MEHDIVYRTAAIKLKTIRDAINDYNRLASEHYLYLMGTGCNDPSPEREWRGDLEMAESGIPREILHKVYEKGGK